ncbi:MAG: hypothetical protein PHS62_02825 [Patescibacteria group bacterium]|nr:hypothetical protein [Patescibacteria group bacterium]
MNTTTKLTFGSGRFGSTVTNNRNEIVVGRFNRPTKLVDSRKDVLLCLPESNNAWDKGYPTHQESWLALAFVIACHSKHHDQNGLAIRKVAYHFRIPDVQWPVLAAKAVEFASEFRQRLAEPGLSSRKAFKSATRALQDCLLYAVTREFPADQDVFLAASPINPLIERANRGRAGELSHAEGLELANEIDHEVEKLVVSFGGIEKCRKALDCLKEYYRPDGRVILLPESITLEQGAELVSFDIILGTPDAHDMDVVSVAEGTKEPRLVQLRDEISGQRMDIIQVSPELGPKDELIGGHRPFQSVAEMLLANGRAISTEGKVLFARLQGQVNPAELAKKYRKVAKEFFSNASDRKSWVSRRAAGTSVPQVKKVLPLYRIACDLLPRASFMEQRGEFTGGISPEKLADEASLGDTFRKIRNVLDRQDATEQELETIAAEIECKL